MHPSKGDMVAGADAYGNSVAGEVIAATDSMVHVQPNKIRNPDGTYSQPPPVAVPAATCAVIEKLADREASNAQRDEWMAMARFAARSRRSQERGRSR